MLMVFLNRHYYLILTFIVVIGKGDDIIYSSQ